MLVSESLNSYRRGRFTIWLIIFNEALTEKDFDFQPAYKEEPLIQGVRVQGVCAVWDDCVLAVKGPSSRLVRHAVFCDHLDYGVEIHRYLLVKLPRIYEPYD